jgi:hypothetical protein
MLHPASPFARSDEYLELLAKEGARLRAQAAGIEAGDASADFEELEDEDEEEEEMGFESRE